MRLVADRVHVIAEGAAACAVAAALSPAIRGARPPEGRRGRLRRQHRPRALRARSSARMPHERLHTEADRPWIRTRSSQSSAHPERLHRLPELANDLWWTWNPRAREVFRQLDYPLWRQTAHNPVLMLRLISPEMLELAAQDERVPRDLRRGDRRARPRPQRARHLVASAVPRQPGPDRLLLRGVRAAPVAADLRRRPRRARRRSLQGSERPRRPADRRRLHVSAGLLPPDVSPEGLAAGSLRAPELGRRAGRAGHRRPTASPASSRCRSATARVLVQVWRVRLGRVKLYLLDTDLEENAPWDRELSARLYGGDRETRIQQEIILGIGGVRALKALGIDAGGVAPQRRARGVRRAAAHPRSDRAGRDVRRRRSRKCGGRRSSRRTRRCRPGTTRSRSTWSRPTWPARGARSAPTATPSWRSATTTTAAGRSST